MLRDRRVWLGVAAVAVLVLAWRVWMPAAAPVATEPRATRPGGSARANGDAEPIVLRPVKLDALSASREQPNAGKRNPFRFQPKAAPPPPRPVTLAPTVPIVQGPAPPPVPAGPPPPPPIPLKFIGMVERANGVKWAVLSDGKSAPQHGKEGDVIDGRYKIVKIGTESIELTYVDGRGKQTVRLTGQ
ncbi:MAG: hypothetical protein Q7R30_03250 [Acidobacteriota bacterium]|nr:hypothetical protein [Acidobacteriota bacterium]